MFLHVEQAHYLNDYRIWLAFNDGTAGEIDLAAELYGEIFEPLKDIEFFKSFQIEGHTLSWQNGADFAPEFLREQILPGKNPPDHSCNNPKSTADRLLANRLQRPDHIEPVTIEKMDGTNQSVNGHEN